RLAAVPMPPGIRPQMTPPTSIMGQIMHVGLHRRKGPQGGDLAPVGQSGLLAERTETAGKAALTVWRPRSRNDLNSWDRVNVGNAVWDGPRAVTFVWHGRSYGVKFLNPLEERMDLRTTADWLLRPRLLKLPGIAEVIIMGGDKKQY